MSQGLDTQRYQYGDARPVQVAFDPTIGWPVGQTYWTSGQPGYAISQGDMCYIDPQDFYRVKAADAFPWTTNLATTQQNFAVQFLGISYQRWDGNNLGAYGIKDGFLRIDIGGVYQMACAAGSTFGPGDFVGPAQNGSANQLAPQTVVKVASLNEAIGWVDQFASSSSTVLVRLLDRSTGYNVGSNLLPTTTTSTTTTSTTTTTTTTTP